MLAEWHLNDGATHDQIRSVALLLGRTLPPDYIRFLGEHDGGEGFIGDNYLILWRTEELGVFNREYEVDKYAAGLLLFGSNGGGEGYGFDLRDPAMPVVRVPFVGMELRYVRAVASSFTELLVCMTKSS